MIPIIEMIKELNLFCDLLPTRNHILVAGLCFIAFMALLLYLYCEVIYLREFDKQGSLEEDGEDRPVVVRDQTKALFQTVRFSIRLRRKIRKIRQKLEEEKSIKN